MSTSAAEVLADAVGQSKVLLARYLTGLTDEHAIAQPAGLPNHILWQLGHLALVMHRACERAGGDGPPASDFTTGDGRAGGGGWFDTESVCYGSTPIADVSLYPTIARAREIFESAADHLESVVRAASPEGLERPVQWGQEHYPWRMIIARVVFHNGTHTGEIVDIRRALGLAKVVG